MTVAARMGGCETPGLWVRALDLVISRARRRWGPLGLPASFAESLGDSDSSFSLDALVWAHDIVLFSSSLPNLKLMYKILSEDMAAVGLSWKPSSLECMEFAREASEVGDTVWPGGNSGYDILVPTVKHLDILGLRLTFDVDLLTMCQHRVGQGWVHYNAREEQFKQRRVPYRLRVQRLYNTVGRTIMFGAAIWGINTAAKTKVASTMRFMCKYILCRYRRDSETEAEYHARVESRLSFLLASFGAVPWEAQISRAVAGWAGHVARMPDSSVVKRLFWWREAAWRLTEHGGTTKYAGRGRPKQTLPDVMA